MSHVTDACVKGRPVVLSLLEDTNRQQFSEQQAMYHAVMPPGA